MLYTVKKQVYDRGSKKNHLITLKDIFQLITTRETHGGVQNDGFEHFA